MSGTVRELIKYPEERAAEDALYDRGLAPTRLCRVLLPVWRAPVRATIYDSEPYDLIDRYVAAGIGAAGLGSAADVAAFYGLDQVVVEGAVRFLGSIGHMADDGAGRLRLTEIGARSVRDGRRYTRALEDRRTLYFDGFTGQPLTKAYYDARMVTFLDGIELGRLLAAADAAGSSAEPSTDVFTPLVPFPPVGLAPQAVEALAGLPPGERARFNLPEQVVAPSLAGAPEQVYLPAYVVRAVSGTGTVEYLAYTQASKEADPEWSRVCTTTAEVTALVENEHESADAHGQEAAARRWTGKVFAGVPGTGRAPIGWRGGVLTATLPAAAFSGAQAPLTSRRIGALVKMGGWYFRLWCDDEPLRRTGLLDLADRFLGSRSKVDPGAARRLARFARQLGFGALTPAQVQAFASSAGRDALAAQLDKLT